MTRILILSIKIWIAIPVGIVFALSFILLVATLEVLLFLFGNIDKVLETRPKKLSEHLNDIDLSRL